MLSSPYNRLQQQHNEKLIKQQLVEEINKIKKRNMLIRQSNFIKMKQKIAVSLAEQQKIALPLEEAKKQQALEEKKQKSLAALLKKQNELVERKKQASLETKPTNKKTFYFMNDTNTEKINLEKEKTPILEEPKNKKTFTFI